VIHFCVASGSSEFAVDTYVSNRGRALAGLVRKHTYDELLAQSQLPRGTWIFAAVDRLGPAGLAIAARLATAVESAGCPVLNHPGRVLRRYDLLSRLHQEGRSRFRLERAANYSGTLRFPVFIRRENQHEVSISGLIWSHSAVRRAILRARLTGLPLDDLLVVELCDLSHNGWHRKYSAWRVGDRIMCRHLQSSRHWVVKSDSGEKDEAAAHLESQFITDNPHRDLLKEYFDFASIQYGRIDYALDGDRVQVWEINTNPTIGPGPRVADSAEKESFREMIRPAVTLHHERFREAWFALDTPGEGCPVDVEIEPALRRAWRRETERDERRERLIDGFRQLRWSKPVLTLRRGLLRLLRRA
jgi:hypothetical protein